MRKQMTFAALDANPNNPHPVMRHATKAVPEAGRVEIAFLERIGFTFLCPRCSYCNAFEGPEAAKAWNDRTEWACEGRCGETFRHEGGSVTMGKAEHELALADRKARLEEWERKHAACAAGEEAPDA